MKGKFFSLIRKVLPVLGALALALLVTSVPVMAATTADITVTATPSYVSITCDQSTYDFGVVATSATPSTTTSWANIDNTSSVQTDQTIAVTSATWSGGVTWTHDDTGAPGANTVGLKANKGGTWGVSDVVVKFSAPNYIAENQAATTDYAFGLKLWAPTSFTDGVQKTNTVRISAAAG